METATEKLLAEQKVRQEKEILVGKLLCRNEELKKENERLRS